MTDLVNALQTLTLLAVLVTTIFVLFMTVNFFKRITEALNSLLDRVDKPTIAPIAKPLPVAEPVEKQQEPESPAERYHCGTCDAKLPEIPKHSVIKDGITILVFKCRRCSKETEVDPAKGQKK